MIRKIEVVPHDPNWVNLFETESKQIAISLGKTAIAIHHICSTSIETIYAKPIIDKWQNGEGKIRHNQKQN